MNESVYCTKICLIGACVFTALCGGCITTLNYQDNAAIIKMTENGSSPQDAACAIHASSERDGICVVIATHKGERNAD